VKKIILAVTGASSVIYGIRILEKLKENNIETHVILSENAKKTLVFETNVDEKYIKDISDYYYNNNDLSAAIASGSFQTDGMIVSPCSIKTLSGVANCYSENLIQRACDVVLKERRRLVLMVRETPLHIGHIDLMQKVSLMGAVILPPVVAMYNNPETIDDIINHTVGKALDLLNIENNIYKRWT